MTELERVIEFAKSNGFYSAVYQCEWNGFKCYEPIFDESRESRKVGMLEILLDKSGNVRMATPEEFFEIIDSLPDEDVPEFIENMNVVLDGSNELAS